MRSRGRVAIALSLCLSAAAPGMAQSIYLRPQSYQPQGPNTLTDPQKAIDPDPLTAALTYWTYRYCNQVCTTPIVKQSEWWGLPDPSVGYRPVELKVKWAGHGVFTQVYAPDTAAVAMKIEYSTDGGGSWNVMPIDGSASGTSGFSTGTKYARTQLLPTQDLSLLRVRAWMEVRMTYCSNNCNRISGVTGNLYVYDITVEVQRPVLTLYLDADGNFDPNDPKSDRDDYVPGSDLATGVSLPVPTTSTLINTVTVIAAYALSNGKIAPPPPGIGTAYFGLTDVSSYSGIAMNYSPGYSGDFAMFVSAAAFDPVDHTARVPLECHDYAARARVTATAGPDNAEMRLPRDDNNNGIPNAGWLAAPRQLSSIGTHIDDTFSATAREDIDPDPTGNGTPGDALGAIEEYRGFVVDGIHKRTNPSVKDLFIYSALPDYGIGDAINLSATVHAIRQSEMMADKLINPYFGNAGYGGDLRHAASTQFGLHVIDGGYDDTAFGQTAVAGGPVGPPRQVVGTQKVFVNRIRECSPPNFDQMTGDVPDGSKITETIGHEVGHGINIDHWTYMEPPVRPLSVMVTYYYPCPPIPPTDPRYQRWNTSFHLYDESLDLNQLRIK